MIPKFHFMLLSILNKRIILFQLILLLGFLQNLHGQTLNISPASASAGETLTITISGTGTGFQQSSSTVCPDSLFVETSNVVFTQGTSTFYPYEIQTYNGVMNAAFFIPTDAIGSYDLTVGIGSPCSITNYGALTINPYVPQLAYVDVNYLRVGQTSGINIIGQGISLQQITPTVCPGSLYVDASNVVFIQGSSTISLDNISTANDVIHASITVPDTTHLGYYDLVIGLGEPCEVILPSALYIDAPYRAIYLNTSYAIAGQSLDVNISGIGVTFDQSSPTVCPSNLNVTSSNVVFRQGSSTIYPNNISTSNGEIIAHLDIPANAASGYYDVTVGYGNSCSITNYSAFYINGMIVNLSPNYGLPGKRIKVDISGANVVFQQGSTTCPDTLNVTASDVVFQQGSSVIYADKVSMQNGILSAEFFIPSDAPIGIYDVVVGNDCVYYGFFNVVDHLAKPNTVVAYPNPSDGTVLNLDIVDPGIHTIYFYNSSGIEIYRETIYSPQLIDIASKINVKLTPGVYLINIITNDGIAKKRIVIN
jgi:hypothetical protein